MRRFLAGFLIVATALALASCGARPKMMAERPLYDVRRAVVTANADVPPAVITGVQRRIDQAIAMTSRPVALPRVVMDIRIDNVTQGKGLDGGQTEAALSITLVDATEGTAFLVTKMPVYSYSLDKAAVDEALARPSRHASASPIR